MDRIYDHLVEKHFKLYKQMSFLLGPRQVGKTTVSQHCKKLTDHYVYLNWDVEDDQKLLLEGQSKVIEKYALSSVSNARKILALDEIHKYPKWRNYVKGIYDKYGDIISIIVTGSSKLDIFRAVGDSLMGRYFRYHVHQLSVRELLDQTLPSQEIRRPIRIDPKLFQDLIMYGGFPDPLLKQDAEVHRMWLKLRSEQLFQDDMKDLMRIHNIAQLKLLTRILQQQVGQLLNYTSLANKVMVSVNTVQSWISSLSGFYYCFTINPWSKNIARALTKNPKLYLWDWSEVDDIGARHENMVACHLKKAVDFWNDTGKGDYELFFMRDKEKNEVDFLVTKNSEPWFLVEVKSSDQSVSKSLYKFQEQVKAKHAFQVVFNSPYVERNCFEFRQPVIVPASTFLSQLV